nr:hypothetical protein [Tanacetum cinerariifolium]
GFPSGFPLGMVPPKNLDKGNSLFPHDSVMAIYNGLRFFFKHGKHRERAITEEVALNDTKPHQLDQESQKGRREKSLSSWKSHDTGASYVMVMEPMAWQTDYCIIKENVHTKRTKIRTWNNSREKGKMERKTTRSSRELHGKELV